MTGRLEQIFCGEWECPDSTQAFLSYLQTDEHLIPPEISIALLAIETDGVRPADLFSSYMGRTYEVETKGLSDWLSVHRIGKRVRGTVSESRWVSGYIAEFRFGNSWYLLTTRHDCTEAKGFRDFIDHCVVLWSDLFTPSILPRTARSRDLLQHLERLEEAADEELLILRSTLRFPHGGHQETVKKEKERLADVLERIVDEGGYLHRVSVSTSGSRSFTATLGRDGQIHWHSGDLVALLEVSEALYGMLESEIGLAHSVTRMDQPDIQSMIELSFCEGIDLRTDEEAERLVEVLDRDSSFAVTVLHGNPYLNVRILDLSCGASLTAYADENRGLRVYPRANVTEAGIRHLVAKLSEGFCEIDSMRHGVFHLEGASYRED